MTARRTADPSAPDTIRADELLYSQGFGARRACEALIAHGALTVAGRVIEDPAKALPTAGLQFEVEGHAWPYRAHAVVLLHKPAGYECSQRPGAWPSVMSLLPVPLRQRGVQPVGRLDADTTGALLLTDDGALNHRLTHPKRHVAKIYQVRTADPVTPSQLQRLLDGVVLRDDPKPARAVACRATGDHALEMTLTEGRYHQVKRMLAAVGNRVEGLHRSAFGPLTLPADLAPRQWCWVDVAREAELRGEAPSP